MTFVILTAEKKVSAFLSFDCTNSIEIVVSCIKYRMKINICG